jgi:hypothetical protein
MRRPFRCITKVVLLYAKIYCIFMFRGYYVWGSIMSSISAQRLTLLQLVMIPIILGILSLGFIVVGGLAAAWSGKLWVLAIPTVVFLVSIYMEYDGCAQEGSTTTEGVAPQFAITLMTALAYAVTSTLSVNRWSATGYVALAGALLTIGVGILILLDQQAREVRATILLKERVALQSTDGVVAPAIPT